MNYLLISNVGVAPIEGYTLLGMSTTRNCGVEGAIGQFGSGTKHAINVLLRAGIKFYVYCGLTRLEFSIHEEQVNDGLGVEPVQKVICKLGGTSTKTIDCGWCLDFGSTDWTEVSMGLREFVSNAIDRTIRETGGFKEALTQGSLKVGTCEETQRRAREGHTQIFIELTPPVQQYYGELPKRFLHFSSNPNQVYQTILPKADRNLTAGRTPMIYRCGVLVREIGESRAASLFDYNFDQKQIKIDECRNSSEYYVRAACAKLMRGADAETLAMIYASLIACEKTFESDLDISYMMSWEAPTDTEKRNWTQAWEKATDSSTVLCKEDMTHAADFVQRKGYQVKKIQANRWVDTAEKFGVSTAGTILNKSEQKGRETLPPTHDALAAVDTVWEWLTELGMTKGKDKPKVSGYRELVDEQSEILGYYEQGSDTVHLREDISSAVDTVILSVALTEIAHYITGDDDNSYGLQQFFVAAVIEAVMPAGM